LLLSNLQNQSDRSAQFRTVIALNLNGKQYLFEGIITGEILLEPRGIGGFGYDPIFMPENATKSFGEMTLSKKNEYSHRARAISKMIDFLKTIDYSL